ncbi:MAG: DUF3472 domain-containing protein [Colwellia sp.]
MYKNQWLYSESGQWHPLTEATFTYDATAEKQARLDYQGGVENGVFYMKNTGFFSKVPLNTLSLKLSLVYSQTLISLLYPLYCSLMSEGYRHISDAKPIDSGSR